MNNLETEREPLGEKINMNFFLPVGHSRHGKQKVGSKRVIW